MQANTEYERVIPRDLFNEAKLLKCIGLVCLRILDRTTPVEMEMEETGQPFKIGLLEDGYLTITNLPIRIKGKEYLFKTAYNSKSNYPLFLDDGDYVEYEVFDDAGNWAVDFTDFCSNL